MNRIALKMLTGDRAKYIGILIGVTFAALLITQQSAIYDGLLERSYASIGDVIGWDERTYMPPKGSSFRADQMALLAKLSLMFLSTIGRADSISGSRATAIALDASVHRFLQSTSGAGPSAESDTCARADF